MADETDKEISDILGLKPPAEAPAKPNTTDEEIAGILGLKPPPQTADEEISSILGLKPPKESAKPQFQFTSPAAIEAFSGFLQTAGELSIQRAMPLSQALRAVAPQFKSLIRPRESITKFSKNVGKELSRALSVQTKLMFPGLPDKIADEAGRVLSEGVEKVQGARSILDVGLIAADIASVGALATVPVRLKTKAARLAARMRAPLSAGELAEVRKAATELLADATEVSPKTLKGLRSTLNPKQVDALKKAQRAGLATSTEMGVSRQTTSLEEIRDLIGRAREEGVHPHTIMTSQERRLYERFRQPVDNAVEFNFPVESILTKEEKSIARQMGGLEDIKEAVPMPKTGKTLINKVTSGNRLDPRIVDNATGREQSLNSAFRKGETEVIKDAAEAAVEHGRRNPDSPLVKDTGTRITQRIVRDFLNENVGASTVSEIANKYGINEADIALEFQRSISESGRQLNAMSQAAKRLNAAFRGNKEATEILNRMGGRLTAFDRFVLQPTKTVVNFGRALLTSRFRTASRNIQVAGFKYGLNMYEDLILGMAGAPKSGRVAFSHFWEDAAAIARKMTKDGRKRVDDILNLYPVSKERLLGSPVNDVVLDKFSRIVNWHNIAQEMFARKLFFDARLTGELRRLGLDPLEISVKNIPENVVENAIEFALESTFAANPKLGPGKTILKFYNQVPIMPIIGETFPRFMMNSTRELVNHSPGGLWRLFSDDALKLISTNKEIAKQRVVAEAMSGITLLGAGYAFSKSKFRGEKWHEVKFGDRKFSLLGHGPYNMYSFMGRLLQDPASLSMRDYKDVLRLGNRQAGALQIWGDEITRILTGRPKIKVKGEDGKDKEIVIRRSPLKISTDAALKFAGNWMSWYTSWLDNASAIAQLFPGSFAAGERTPRTKRVDPILGPLKKNIPAIKQTLPEYRAITKGESLTRNQLEGMAFNFLGIAPQDKDPLRDKIQSLGVDPFDFAPRTGIPELDLLASAEMGRFSKNMIKPAIIDEKVVDHLPQDEQIIEIRKMFNEARNAAIGTVIKDRLELQVALELKGAKTQRERAAIKEAAERMGVIVTDE